jgi:hypothetical protein
MLPLLRLAEALEMPLERVAERAVDPKEEEPAAPEERRPHRKRNTL